MENILVEDCSWARVRLRSLSSCLLRDIHYRVGSALLYQLSCVCVCLCVCILQHAVPWCWPLQHTPSWLQLEPQKRRGSLSHSRRPAQPVENSFSVLTRKHSGSADQCWFCKTEADTDALQSKSLTLVFVILTQMISH